MEIRDIVVHGNPVLMKRAEAVSPGEDGLEDLIRDMKDTLEFEEGLGLAANQIGVGKSVMVLNMAALEDDPPEPVLVLLNPEIVSSKGRSPGEEGCLSLPEITETVVRPSEIKLQAMDLHGKMMTIEARELKARVICHEVDHLEGLTLIERLGTVRRQMLKPYLKKLAQCSSRRDYLIAK